MNILENSALTFLQSQVLTLSALINRASNKCGDTEMSAVKHLRLLLKGIAALLLAVALILALAWLGILPGN